MIEDGQIEHIFQELRIIEKLFDWYLLVAARYQEDVFAKLPIIH